MSSADEVLSELDDGVLIVSLNRPERRNALGTRAIDALCALIDEADARDEVRAVVLTGVGRAFCAGGDISGGPETFAPPASSAAGPTTKRDRGGVLALRIFACLKPFVAAVNGDAVGLGATMLLPMDARIAASGARFGFPFVRRGIVPESASTWFLPRLVGIGRALNWTLSGRVFPAEEALEAGLVDRVVDDDRVLAAAIGVARDLSEGSSGPAVAATRQLMWHGLTLAHPMAAHRAESAAIRHLGGGADAREGIASFLEKRPAEFAAGTGEGVAPLRGWWREPPYEAALVPGERGLHLEPFYREQK